MAKPLSNQTSAVLWGGRGIGRSITLALARNGSQVAFADPSPPDLEKVRDLLIGKKADIFATGWAEALNEGEETYARGADDVMMRMFGAYPYYHRVVLAAGVDERFWTGPVPGDPVTPDLILGRLEAMVRRTVGALAGQGRPGRLLILWPSEGGLLFDEARLSIIRLGETRLRDLTEEAAGQGVGVSLLWLGPSEDNLWADVPKVQAERLRLGEIADAMVALAGMPRRVVLEEATLCAFGSREAEKG